MAVEETGMGIVEDKVIKNNYASEYIYNAYKNTKTCGVIEEDKAFGIKKIAEPIGVIAVVIPTTNPTSTAIFKCLIALKTRNAIIISPHPRAKNSTIAAAKLVLEAAVTAGGYGHTSSVYLNEVTEQDKLAEFAARMKTCRILVNTPSSHGGIGDLYNFKLAPSLTLGCGSWGGNSVSDNVGVKHLLNIKTVAERRENMLWFRAPEIEGAKKQLDLFCEKSNTAKHYVQKRMPIVAAFQSVKGNEHEREFLLSWVNVVDYE